MNPPAAPNLERALNYLQTALRSRLAHHTEGQAKPFELPPLPAWNEAEESAFGQFLRERRPQRDELLVLMLALAPQAWPHFFDSEVARHFPQGGDFPEFGGLKGSGHRGLLPTGDTALFLLAGSDLARRLQVQQWFRHDSFFTRERLVILEAPRSGEPPMSGRLLPDPEIAEWLLTGSLSIPRLSPEFPAQYLSTELDWEDLVLDPQTLVQIREIEEWLAHNADLLYGWGLHKRIKPGYRALFYGPPGTGKTLTATLLGKYSQRPVFRVDLSMVVSKYIGETEKNLSTLFEKAEHKDWILFFDEADALFGKRTSVRDAHDRYANQEVSYLLQRVEGHPGLVILASNQKGNIDEAFTRRFQSMIYFPLPKAPERLRLWQAAFPPQVELAPALAWEEIARRYELSGANIVNIVHFCCLRLLAQKSSLLTPELLLAGIRREFAKEDKVMG